MANPRDVQHQNKNPFNFLSKIRSFMGGANTKAAPELLGLEDQKGQYIDARNARFDDEEADGLGLSKIQGEQIKFDLSGVLSNDYECICFAEVNSRLFTVWASNTGGNYPCICIDDVLVCKSVQLGFNTRHHIQFDYNDNEVGEIYLTDNFTVPIYFDISDLIASVLTQKYFSSFQRAEYEINFSEANNLTVFDGLVNTGGGLPTGKYSYAFRYINDNSVGSLSIWTPNVTVPASYDTSDASVNPQETPYPRIKTYGSAPSPISNTSYAPQLRFRINNVYNYSYVEIVRCSYNTGSGLNAIGGITAIKRIPISNGQIGVVTYIDNSMNSNEAIALDKSTIDQLSPSIKRAKAIRYFYNKVILGNIEYEDRTLVEGENYSFILDVDGNAKNTPMLKDLGINGLKDSYENCYNTPYMNGEAYGFGIVFRDGTNGKTFVAPVTGLQSVEFPNRRDEMTADAIAASDPSSIVSLASVNGVIRDVYECVDNTKLTTKIDPATGSIPTNHLVNSNANVPIPGFYGGVNVSQPQYRIKMDALINICSDTNSNNNILAYGYPYNKPPYNYGYNPFTPTKLSDSNFNYGIQPQSGVGYQGARYSYNPALFQPRYNALGLSIKGLSTWPTWASSFQIVRTQRAGRVVCQGLGFWDIKSQPFTPEQMNAVPPPGSNNAFSTQDPSFYNGKQLSRFSFHIQDSDSAGIDPALVADVMQNPQNYSVQLVAPLGIASEVFSYYSMNTGVLYPAGWTTGNPVRADICAYARIQVEQNARRKNPTGAANSYGIPSGADGYTAYGRWINNTPSPAFPGYADGNTLFSINSFMQDNSENGANLFFLELNTNIYNSDMFLMGQMYVATYSTPPPALAYPPTNAFTWPAFDAAEMVYNWFDFGDTTGLPNINNPGGVSGDFTWFPTPATNSNKEFMEPVYIINIVRSGQSVQQTDFSTYIQTGANIMLDNTMFISDGYTSRIEICGERINDCCSFFSQADDNYLWVDVLNNGNYVRYIDITYKSSPQIALINSDIINHTTYYNGHLLFGTYTIDLVNTITLGNNVVPRYLILNTIPDVNCSINCKYDNRYSISVFGGDTYVGESTAPLINRQSAGGGTYCSPSSGYASPETPDGDILPTTIGFPYNNIELNPAVGVLHETNTTHSYLNPSYVPDSSNGVGLIGNSQTRVLSIRQLICIYTAQCYSAIHIDYSEKFPNINYVMRPGFWEAGTKPSLQGVFGQYELDYPNEDASWNFGGLKIKNGVINSDYAVAPIHDIYTSGTQFTKTNNIYRNRVAWSITRPIESYNSPSLRLFVATNIFDTNDATGEIKKLYTEATQYYGENIYAFTEDDIAMLMTQKTILSGANGAQVAAQDNGTLDASFVSKQLWFGNKKMGALQDEMWMTCGESGKGIFFCNKNSAFLFKDNTLVDLLQEYEYYGSVNNRLLKRLYDWQFNTAYPTDLFTGVYNRKKKEYLFGAKLDIKEFVFATNTTLTLNSVSQGSINRNLVSMEALTANLKVTFVNSSADVDTFYVKVLGAYSVKIYNPTLTTLLYTAQVGDVVMIVWNYQTGIYTVKLLQNSFEYRDNYLFSLSDKLTKKGFNGVFDWNYDKYYSSLQQNLFGVKGQKIYLVDSGDSIDGSPVIFEAIQAATPVEKKSVEFSRLSISSTVKPTSIDFYQASDITTLIATLDGALLKNYHSFENYVPRNLAGNRIQGNYLVYNVKHNAYGDFMLKLVDTQFKVIK